MNDSDVEVKGCGWASLSKVSLCQKVVFMDGVLNMHGLAFCYNAILVKLGGYDIEITGSYQQKKEKKKIKRHNPRRGNLA